MNAGDRCSLIVLTLPAAIVTFENRATVVDDEAAVCAALAKSAVVIWMLPSRSHVCCAGQLRGTLTVACGVLLSLGVVTDTVSCELAPGANVAGFGGVGVETGGVGAAGATPWPASAPGCVPPVSSVSVTAPATADVSAGL